MYDRPQSPKSFYRERHVPKAMRKRTTLEEANERMAQKEERFLKWIHPTKGMRKMAHARMRASMIINQLRDKGNFHAYVSMVAKGVFRKAAKQ